MRITYHAASSGIATVLCPFCLEAIQEECDSDAVIFNHIERLLSARFADHLMNHCELSTFVIYENESRGDVVTLLCGNGKYVEVRSVGPSYSKFIEQLSEEDAKFRASEYGVTLNA